MNLRERAVKSTAWYGGTRLITQLVSWVMTVLLARLLTPADYGIFAMALSVVAFLELFQEFGLGVAIVQRPEVTHTQLNTIFWLTLGASSLLVITVFASAPLFAEFYAEPRLEGILRLLMLTFPLNGMGLVPYNLLTREIDFRRRSLAEGLAVVFSTLIAIIFAALGHGVWALVVGYLARAIVRNGALVALCGWLPGLDVSWRSTRDMIAFGLNVAGSTLVTTFSNTGRTAILGRFLGNGPLGLFTMAETLGLESAHKLYTSVVNQLSLPVFAKLQRDDEVLRRYFLRITRYLGVVCVPAQIGIFLAADNLVAVLLTPKWAEVAPLLRIFALGGLFYVLPLPSAPVLTARGKAYLVFRFSVGSAFVMLPAFLVGAQFGLTGAVGAWAIAFPLVRLFVLRVSLMEIGITARRYLENLAPVFLSASAMAVLILLVRSTLPLHGDSLAQLLRDLIVGVVAYPGVLVIVDRRLGIEVRGIVHDLFATSRAS